MARLTESTILKADPPKAGQRFIFDDHREAPSGFALRVTKAGGKAFTLRYKIDGRQHLKTIGQWPAWTLAAARAEARNLVQMIDQGRDPLEEDRQRKESPTVADLAADWLVRHASGLKSEGAIRGYMNNDLTPALGRMKVGDVRRRDLIAVIERKAETAPRAAGQLLIYARMLFDFATDREYIVANPLAGFRPSKITVRGKRAALTASVRKRILDIDEIRSFWASAETCGIHRLSALALKFILVTGQRPGEVAGIHRDEVRGRWWTIPASRRGKTETDHEVYLTDTAISILDEARAEIDRLQRRRKATWAGFFFETRPGASVTTSALWRAVKRNKEALGNKEVETWGPWRPHDLRRSMRTALSACRVRPDIAELCIGHTKSGMIGVYDQFGFKAEKQQAFEDWEARLFNITQGNLGAVVVL